MAEPIEITIDAKKLQETLDHFAKNLDDMSIVMASVATELSNIIEKNFDSEGERLDKKWQELKPETLKQKKEKADGISDKILQDEGNLITSFVQSHTSTEARIQTDSIYSAIHNFGGPCGRNKAVDMPKREYAALNNEDIETIYEIITNFINPD